MITLKQLVEQQVITDETDEAIIVRWAEENDEEEKLADIVATILKGKIAKKNKARCRARSDMTMELCGTRSDTTREEDHLYAMAALSLALGEPLSKWLLDELKENMSKRERPGFFNTKLEEHLREKGIEFKKGEKK